MIKIPKPSGIQSFLFISLFAVLLMGMLLLLHKKSTNSITELQQGNELAGKTFSINNTLQEIVNGIYTIENSFRLSLQQGTKADIASTNSTLLQMNENKKLLEKITSTDSKDTLTNQFSSLINEKALIFDNIVKSWPDKAMAIDLLTSSKNSLLNDNIYELAIRIQLNAENKLQKKINQNFTVSHQVLSISKWFTFLALAAILILGTIIISHLIKNHKLINDLELAKHEADNAANIKEQFLANMSHEIRTPVNSIIGFTKLLEKTNSETDKTQFVSHIKKSGENLLTIVNDILDISKIEAGMLRFQNEPFNLNELCYYIEMLFYNEQKNKGIDFKSVIEKNVPLALIGDDERLKQILTNLISNAFKFTEKGFIHFTISLLKQTKEIAILKFSVKDSGIGIANDKLNTIFERFEQANNDTLKMYGGTGLGLSIVKKLVTLQNGQISVESELGKGTEFIFTMPLKLPGAATEEFVTQISEQPKTEENVIELSNDFKILVAEDNKMNQLLLHYIFKQWGISFTLANNGLDAIEYLKKQTFDLILLDIQMPIMDGYATTKWIREELKSDVPIIAMTAFVLQGEKDKCFAFGMNEYLPKPINESKLKLLVTKYVNLNKLNLNTLKSSPAISKTNVYVDLNYLNTMFNNNTLFIKNILELFIKQYPKDLDLLKIAVSNKNIAEIKRKAHHLKSTVTSVIEFAPQFKELEFLEALEPNFENWSALEAHFNTLQKTEGKAIDEAKKIMQMLILPA